jgi:hypothetical protein
MKYLRKRSRNPLNALKRKADKALQEWHRAHYKEECECCGKPFELMHHHLPKSQSSFGRYNHDNLIFLCKVCHNALHFGTYNIVSTYTLKRGKRWKKKIDWMRQQYLKLTPKYLEEIIEKYEQKEARINKSSTLGQNN